MQIGIIGGGVAGMFCALNLKGHSVTVLEKNEDTLKKMLITGNGRCNATNLKSNSEFLENVLHNANFLHSSLNGFSAYDYISFLTNNGVDIKLEDNNRVFPATNKAITIKNCFDNLVSKSAILKLNTCALSVKKVDEKFEVETNNGCLYFDVLIVATGGVTYPTTGSSGDGYRFAENFSILVNKPRGSLCGIRLVTVPENFEGLPLNCKLSIKSKGKVLCENTGEFLFTGYGVSGPNVFTLTAKVDKHSINGDSLCFDFLPNSSSEDVLGQLKNYISLNQTKFVFHAVNSLLNIKIAKLLLLKLNIAENKQCAQISNKELNLIVNAIKNFELEIDNFDNVERATVTRGGINVKEVNPKTMESKKVENLFFIGEVLDVDALSGGYNLQIAYSTAYACATYLNEKFKGEQNV